MVFGHPCSDSESESTYLIFSFLLRFQVGIHNILCEKNDLDGLKCYFFAINDMNHILSQGLSGLWVSG